MLDRVPLIHRITSAFALMESYLKLNSRQNLNTASVLAEDFCVNLLNLLYGANFTNLNAEKLNAPAVDLVFRKKRLAFQITINDTTAKIRDTHLQAASPDIANNFDRITILFLVNKAPPLPKKSAKFTPCTSPTIVVRDLSSILGDICALAIDGIGTIAGLLEREIRNPAKPWNRDANLRPSNLPYTSLGTLFKGRDTFLTDLHERLTGHTATHIKGHAIHGLGGVGKTRAAVEYAWRYHPHYTALLFVSTDSPETLDTQLAALCHAGILNLPEKSLTDQSDQKAAVLTWLNAHPGWLIIVDNADTEDALAAVDQLLPKLSDGHVIITSRMTDYAGGIDAVPLDVLSDDDAAAFLLERTADHRTTAPDDDVRAIELAHELGGLALALEQSSAHIRKERLSFSAYLDLWHSNTATALHWYNARTMHYPRSLAVTYQTSVDQLSEPAKEFFCVLAWFAPDPIPLTALEGDYAPADARALLAELENLSLARRDAAGTTFTVHRLVQEITRQQQPALPPPTALFAALDWINSLYIGDSQNVSTWPVLEPLTPHAHIVALRSADCGILEPSGSLFNNIALLYATKAQHAIAETLYRLSVALAEVSLGDNQRELAVRLDNLAEVLQTTNRQTEAEPIYRRSLAIAEACLGKDHPDVAITLSNLALLLQSTNRLAEAEPLMRRSLAISEAALGTDHPWVANALNNLAYLLKSSDRFADAEALYRRALAIDEAFHGNDHHFTASRLTNLAQLLQATNRSAEAEPLIRRALAINEASFGSMHPNVAHTLNNLAQLLHATNRHAEAEPLIRRSLSINEAAFGPQHPNVARALNNLAKLLQDTNRLDEAEPPMRRALAIWESSLGKDHPHVAANLRNLAKLLHSTNRLTEAEPIMRRILDIDEASLSPQHPDVAIDLNNLATLLKDTNQLAEAEPLMRRALAIDETAFGPNHFTVAIRLNNLALLLQATKRLSEAEPLMRRMLEILVEFTRATGCVHPHLQTGTNNFGSLLMEMGGTQAEADQKINKIIAPLHGRHPGGNITNREAQQHPNISSP